MSSCANASAAGQLNLRQRQFALDESPIDAECGCFVCREYTRAYLHHVAKDHTGCQLLTYHNIAYQMRLMGELRAAILAGELADYVRRFMLAQFPRRNYPQWTVDALAAAGIELYDCHGNALPAQPPDAVTLETLAAAEHAAAEAAARADKD